MSRIAIAAALQEELGALLAAMPDERAVRLAGREFWVGHLDGQDVVVALSRVGKVAAAMTATLLVHEFGAEQAIFTGTAGGLDERARVGDVVVASALLQHDMDASPLFPRHEVPLYGTDRFTCDERLSRALADAAGSVLAEATASVAPSDDAISRTEPSRVAVSGAESPRAAVARSESSRAFVALCADDLRPFAITSPRVHTGLVVSGDRFVARADDGAELRRRLPDALAVEMEGAALAQVCHDLGVPCAVVRTISDRADNAATGDFTRFVESVASRYTLAIVRRFLGAWPGA